MSSDRRPAKVRVVSSGRSAVAPGPASGPVRQRRRGDNLGPDTSPTSAQPGKARDGASLLWIAGAMVLFLVGCGIGGALFMVSGLALSASL